MECEYKETYDFKGVWIKKSIAYNKHLSSIEKVFLAYIDNIINNQNECFATNTFFSKIFQLSKTRCSQLITSLKDKGFINVKYITRNKEIIKRIISIKQRSLHNE